MLNKENFLEKYNIGEDEFTKAKIEWKLLDKIYNDYLSVMDELEAHAEYIAKAFLKLKSSVHSVKYRVKDAEHLIEKIIRKKLENSSRDITIENYREQITDLVGVRILHLFKDEWEEIHDFIANNWGLNEQATANVRDGDNTDCFKEKNCNIKVHKAGYRSVHYLINSRPRNKDIITEIQVRTIFEEAWSEIDHKVRYPYDTNNEMLAEYLVVFNRLAGSADEMGTFLKTLVNKLKEINENHKTELEARDIQIQELNTQINKLQGQIKNLKIDAKQKADISDTIGIVSNLFQKHRSQLELVGLGASNSIHTKTIADIAKISPQKSLAEMAGLSSPISSIAEIARSNPLESSIAEITKLRKP